MPEITNMENYNERMRKSFMDKMFFVDKVKATVFVDFGCADGSFLKFLKSLFPDAVCFGYDNCEKMIALAKKDNQGIVFTTDWNEITEFVRMTKEKTCLFMLSVIHEVYSYGMNTVGDFWKQVFDSEFDYIAIRDMCVSKTASRQADPITVARVRQLFAEDKLAEWESIWGSIDENWSLTHFLLTYRYAENWKREARENYLPINKEELLSKFPRHYMPLLIEHYTLPFLRQCVWDDFDVQLQERTHLKLVYEKSK